MPTLYLSEDLGETLMSGWWPWTITKEEWELLFPQDDSDFPKSGEEDKEEIVPEATVIADFKTESA